MSLQDQVDVLLSLQGNTAVENDMLHSAVDGYTFSLPGHYSNAAAFVDWRWRIGGQTLDNWERDALQRLVGDPTLFGLDSALPPDRAAALRARADRMLSTNVILRPGEY
jgi:hypothetical protein